ncbi:MAG: PaaI family thioesterase [Pseudomonadales bacterium]|nr:PaaI family thioesterase [Pseudomonadales bacterium]
MSEQKLPFPFGDLIGFKVTHRDNGVSHSELEIGEKHMNPHGIAHGGAVFSLVDTCMGSAVSSMLADGEMCSTIEIKINYLRPAVSGRVICESSVLNKGKRTAVVESKVLDQQGREICRALGTFMVIQR